VPALPVLTGHAGHVATRAWSLTRPGPAPPGHASLVRNKIPPATTAIAA
jgi:hypothetical protein